MKFASICLAIAAALPVLADYDGGGEVPSHRKTSRRYCNHGTQGNHGCEDNNLHTYCCNIEQTAYFEVYREVTVMSRNLNGDIHCEMGGYIFCAA
ncbi:hypothetical protein E4U21_004257 [Claviceps maximensis]|nr:hypothetical protein E4U21_004257 [Claviceps maximensis]